MKNLAILLTFSLLMKFTFAQGTIEINIDASSSVGQIEPLWGDHWEYHFLHGFGGNPNFEGPHELYITDPSFEFEMERLEPRSIRQSIGAFTNPPSSEYCSTDTDVLKNLWTEFYIGPNTLEGANDLTNYNFTYLDSLIKVYNTIGAEPFLVLDYMPFALASDQTAQYSILGHLLCWDNSIRNSPPSNFEVFGRVMYQTVKYAYEQLGVTTFEFWNEPDQLAPFNTYFFKGTADDLFKMYQAMMDEIEADETLSDNITMGCCSFAFNSAFNLFPGTFLGKVQDNNVRMDYLSFHPYSETDAGYDEDRVIIAKNLRDQYVPNAFLANAEWGRLSPDFGASNWKSLEYGLNKIEALINMNKHDIKYAHAATLIAIDDSALETCCIGIYDVNPIKPKGSAYAYYYMNRLNDHLNKLALSSNLDDRSIAGINNLNNSIVVALAAPNIDSGEETTISLNIENLPWTGDYEMKRYELSEDVIEMDELNNLVFEQTGTSESINDEFTYTSIQNNGKLIIWEIYDPNTVANQNLIKQNRPRLFPNPTQNNFHIENGKGLHTLEVISLDGKLVQSINLLKRQETHEVKVDLPGNIYLIKLYGDELNFTDKLVIID